MKKYLWLCLAILSLSFAEAQVDSVTNFAKADVSTGYDASATTIVVASGKGALFPVSGYNLVWWCVSSYLDPSDDPNVEIVRVTNRVADTFTIVRGQEGTVATVKNAGGKTYRVILSATAKLFTDLNTTINDMRIDSSTTGLNQYLTAATAGVIRSVPGIYNVVAYGATTANADQRVYFQAAIDAAGAAGGGIVMAPTGSWRIDSTLHLHSYVTLAGEGPGATTLNFTNATSMWCITADGTNGANISLTSNAAATDTNIAVTSAAGIIAGDYLIIGSAGVFKNTTSKKAEWVRVKSVATNTISAHNYLYDNYLTADGAWVKEITPIVNAGIRDLYIQRAAQEVTVSRNIWANYAVGFVVDNVKANGGTRNAVDLYYVYNAKVTNCVFENNWYTGSDESYGVEIVQTSQFVDVSNNFFHRFRHAVSSGADTGASRFVTVTNNRATSTNTAGVYAYAYDAHPQTQYWKFDGNFADCPGGYAMGIGGYDMTATNNTLRGAGGIFIYTNDSVHSVISNNNISLRPGATGSGIYCMSSFVTINGNHVWTNSTTNTSSFLIRVDPDASNDAATDIDITNNSLYGRADLGMYLNGVMKLNVEGNTIKDCETPIRTFDNGTINNGYLRFINNKIIESSTIIDVAINLASTDYAVTMYGNHIPRANTYTNATDAQLDSVVFYSGIFGNVLNVYNVRLYGARADTTISDSAAFMSAINAASANGGGRVYVPKGQYWVGTLNLPSNIELFGEGDSSIIMSKNNCATGVLQITGTDSGLVNNPRNIYVHDLQLRSSWGSFEESYHLMRVLGATSLRVERVKFEQWRGDAIYLGSTGSGATRSHNLDITIRDCFFDGVTKLQRQAISVIDGTDLLIENNRFTRSTANDMPGAIDIEPNTDYDRTRNITIRGNYFTNIGGMLGVIGIVLEPQSSSYFPRQNFLIEGNIIDSCYGTANLAGIGIQGGGAISDSTIPHNIIVRDNVIKRVSKHAEIFGVNTVSFVNNLFEDTDTYGFMGYSGAADSLKNISWIGNTFNRCSKTNGTVHIIYNIKGLTFDRNTYIDCGKTDGTVGRIASFASSTRYHNVTFTNNRIVNPSGRTTAGILSSGSPVTDREKNVFFNNDFLGLDVSQFPGSVTKDSSITGVGGHFTGGLKVDGGFTGSVMPVVITVAMSDETTALTASTSVAKVTYRAPFAFTLTGLRASVTTAPTDATILVDVHESGTTVLGASNKVMIDATELTSTTATTAYTITDAAIADDAALTFFVDQIGSTVAGAGLKVTLYGTRVIP